MTSNYGDYSQYLVTTTIVTPNGSRYSTTQAGWDYAAVTDTGYLDISTDDGTYTVESYFEGTNGYVSSDFITVTVAAQVSVGRVLAVPPSVLPGSGLAIVAAINFTSGVTSNAAAVVELNETENFNNVLYDPGTPTGTGVTNTSINRELSLWQEVVVAAGPSLG